jgi:microcystin-dependent protein
MEPFIGQIMMVGFNFAPRGWAFCDGALLPINSNQALFSLLGTTYGGDGRTTFGLPDLRGRIAKHVGTGPGLSPVRWGERGGAENHTLTVAQMPQHTHSIGCNSSAADSDTPENGFPAVHEGGLEAFHTAANASMNALTAANTGGNRPFDIRNPYLGIYHVIALVGLFPSRS